jgi:hypothetical protein
LHCLALATGIPGLPLVEAASVTHGPPKMSITP